MKLSRRMWQARRKIGPALLLGGLIGLAAPPAYADERADARRHFRAGMDLIGRRRFSEGIAELEAAYAILPHPNVVYNIARAYYDQGDFEHAIVYLRRYTQSDVPDRAEVDAIIARLETRLRGTAAASAPAAPSTTATSAAPPASSTPAAPSASASADPTPTLPADASAQQQALIAAAQRLMRLAGQMQGAQPGHGATGASAGSGDPAPDTHDRENRTDPNAGAAGRSGGEAIRASGDDDVYEERVVTASRVAQSPLDAPNATGVITAQDIRLSGATSVPQLLRRIAGVDIMALESGDYDVSIRGFNQRLSNKVLVLVDGRSVYLDFLGVTLWPLLFPAVEEIERIEVIRGPGSALYGADAFSGVINIITRAPGESRNVVSVGAGNGQWLRGAFITSGRQGDLSYRASVQFEQQATFERQVSEQDDTWRFASPAGDAGYRIPRFNLDLQQRLGRGVVLRGGVGAATGPLVFTPTGLLRRFWTDVTLIQPYVQLDAGGFTGRMFWNRVSATAGPVLEPIGGRDTRATCEQDVIDVDLQYASRQTLGIAQNTLQLGLGYRMKHISFNYTDADHALHFFSAFIQDTLRLSDRFSAIASARVDRHPVLENPVFSPRAALIYRPTPNRAIRVSGGTAFRTPTMLELYFDLYYPTPIPGATVTGQGSEVAHERYGSPRLRPETALSFDIGYQDRSFDRVQFEANLFWTRGTDLINLGNVAIAPLPGNTSMNREVDLGTRTYVNFPGATYVYGAEIGTRISPIDGLDILGNYTLALTAHDPDSPLAGEAGLQADQRTPMHKVNVGVQVRSRIGLDFEGFGSYVSRQYWIEPVFDARQGSREVTFPLSDYFVLNARIGYRLLQDRLDLGVVGTNIADAVTPQGHQEHPLGARMTFRVLATASYRF